MPPSAGDVLNRLSHRTTKTHRASLGVETVDTYLGGGVERGGLHEVRATLARDIGAGAGALVGLLARLGSGGGRILWVTDPAVVPDAGLLNPDGLAQMGLDPARLTLVHAMDLKTALWAADEGARCTDLAAVVLHVKGNPARLDRVAVRRLMLRAQTSGVTVFILRQSGAEEAGAAHTRWCVTPRPSHDRTFPAGIGPPAMTLTLERTRDGRTGAWPLTWDPKDKRFTHDTQNPQEIPVDRPAPPAHRPDRTGPMGQVVALGRTP